MLLGGAVVTKILTMLWRNASLATDDLRLVFVVRAPCGGAVMTIEAFQSLNLHIVTHFPNVPLILHEFITNLGLITQFVPGFLVTTEDQTTEVVRVDLGVALFVLTDYFLKFHVVLSGTVIVPKANHGAIRAVMHVFYY
jgi:hypothetical protein